MSDYNEFDVEAGVVAQTIKRAASPKKRLYPLHTMEVDKTIFVPDKDTKNFTTYVHKQGRQLKRKFRTQATIMRRDPAKGKWVACDAEAPDARRGVAVTRLA